jgi:hypothetical protein
MASVSHATPTLRSHFFQCYEKMPAHSRDGSSGISVYINLLEFLSPSAAAALLLREVTRNSA